MQHFILEMVGERKGEADLCLDDSKELRSFLGAFPARTKRRRGPIQVTRVEDIVKNAPKKG